MKKATKVSKEAKAAKATEGSSKVNRVLAILSDRTAPLKTPRYVEIFCKPDGTVLKETALKRPPVKPEYDEVWENDDGRTSLDSCTRMRRHYRHGLLRPKSAAA